MLQHKYKSRFENSIMNEKETNEKDNSVENLFKSVKNKFEIFESNLLNMKKALSAKDIYIQAEPGTNLKNGKLRKINKESFRYD